MGAARAAARSDGAAASASAGAAARDADAASSSATSVGAGDGGVGATEAAPACGDATPQQRLGSAAFRCPQSCVQHESARSSAMLWVAAPYDAEVPTTSRSATLQRSSERFVTSSRLYVALLTCNVPGRT